MGYARAHVQDGGRAHGALPWDDPHGGGRCPICKSSPCAAEGFEAVGLTSSPQVGLNFMTYEVARTYLTPDGDANPSAVRKLLAGAISGAVAQTCTYPL